VVVTAQGNAFIPAQVTAPADAAFTLFLVNKDGEPHNARIWDAAGTSVFAGEHFTGPAAKAEQIPALAAGTYRISCDIHPDMTGQLVAQ
jgi:plastocyanin